MFLYFCFTFSAILFFAKRFYDMCIYTICKTMLRYVHDCTQLLISTWEISRSANNLVKRSFRCAPVNNRRKLSMNFIYYHVKNCWRNIIILSSYAISRARKLLILNVKYDMCISLRDRLVEYRLHRWGYGNNCL